MKILQVFCFSALVFSSCIFVAYFGKRWNLKPIAALGAGALLSICFLDFLPYAFSSSTSHEMVSVFILSGIFIQGLADVYLLPRLNFLDKRLKFNPHTHEHSHTLTTGSVCSVAGCLTICSFFDGIRLFAALNMTETVAFATALSLFFHLLSEGAVVAALVLSSGFKKRALFVLLFCITGALTLGAGIAQLFSMSFSSGVIAFSSGILIYVCFVHLLPFALKENKKSWLFIGLLLFLFIHFFLDF